MNIVLLGPPGAGKGAQARRLEAALHIPHVTLESYTSEDAQKGGSEAEALSPEAQVVRWVDERLQAPDCARGFILDGFPGTLPQAEGLERYLAARQQRLSAVVVLEVPEELLFERLSGRRVCPRDRRVFNIFFFPPATPDRCDECLGPLIQRDNESPEALERRLLAYSRERSLLRRFYGARGLWCPVAGEGRVESVHAGVLRALANAPVGANTSLPSGVRRQLLHLVNVKRPASS